MPRCLPSGWVSRRDHFGKKLTSCAQAKQVSFRTTEGHVLDYLQLKVQELCTRNAVKCLHVGFMYLATVAEAVPEDRLTSPVCRGTRISWGAGSRRNRTAMSAWQSWWSTGCSCSCTRPDSAAQTLRNRSFCRHRRIPENKVPA